MKTKASFGTPVKGYVIISPITKDRLEFSLSEQTDAMLCARELSENATVSVYHLLDSGAISFNPVFSFRFGIEL